MQSLVPLRFRPVLQNRISLVEEIRNLCDKRSGKIAKQDLPVKPKRPGNSYIQFIKVIHPKLVSEYPTYSHLEIVKTAAKIWRNSDDTFKAEYLSISKSERDKYTEALKFYNESLTSEQSAELILQEERAFQRKYRARIKKKLRELGKPTQPPGPYALYLYETGVTYEPGETKQERFERVAAGWNQLSAKEKDKYRVKSAELRKIYEQELKNWESKFGTTIYDLNEELKQNELFEKAISEKVKDNKSKSETATEPQKPKS